MLPQRDRRTNKQTNERTRKDRATQPMDGTGWYLMVLGQQKAVLVVLGGIGSVCSVREDTYMQKTCDVAEKAILAKKKLRKKCVYRDKM